MPGVVPQEDMPDNIVPADDLPDHTNVVADATAHNLGPFHLPPLKYDSTNPANTDQFRTSGQINQTPWSPQEQQMAQQGIDITSGAPYGLQNKLSMIVKPTPETMKRTINQYFGRDVNPTFSNGEWSFISPDTGRPTLIKSHAVQSRNLAPTAGGTMDAALQTAGAVGGGALGSPASPVGTLAGASIGAGVGQFVSDAIKEGVSRISGWLDPSDKLENDLAPIGLNVGGAVAATAAGGAILSGVPRAYNWFFRGNLPLKYGEAVRMQDMMDKTQDSLKDWYELVGSQKTQINPSVPETLLNSDQEGASELGAEARTTFRQAYSVDKSLAAKEEARRISNLNSLQQGLKDITDQYKPSDDYVPGSAGYDIRQALIDEKKQAIARQVALNSATRSNAARVASGQPPLTEADMTTRLTDMLNTSADEAHQDVNTAYADLKTKLGVPSEVASLTNSDRLLQGQQPSVFLPYTKVARIKLQNFWQEAMNASDPSLSVDPDIGVAKLNAIPDGLLKEPGNPRAGLVDFDNTNHDLFQTIEAIQALRSGTRANMTRTKGLLSPESSDLSHIEDILSSNVEDYLNTRGDPTIMDAWENAQQKARNYAATFRSGILNEVMTKENGFPTPTYNQAVPKLLMSAGLDSPSMAGPQQLAAILKGNPQATQDVRAMIWQIYNNHFMPADGVPTPSTFNQFKGKMYGAIKAFFTEHDMDDIDSFDKLTKMVANSDRALQEFRSSWGQTPFGSLNASSNTLSKAVFQDSYAPQKLQGLSQYLTTANPELLGELQADTARGFADRSSDINGVPDFRKMDLAMRKYGDKLNMVMGPEYAARVQVIQNAAKTVQGGMNLAIEPEKPQSILQQAVRALFAPPMSSEGRWYSGLLIARNRAAARVVYNALSSPQGLKDFIGQAADKHNELLQSTVAGALGGRTLLMGSTPQSGTQGGPQQ